MENHEILTAEQRPPNTQLPDANPQTPYFFTTASFQSDYLNHRDKLSRLETDIAHIRNDIARLRENDDLKWIKSFREKLPWRIIAGLCVLISFLVAAAGVMALKILDPVLKLLEKTPG